MKVALLMSGGVDSSVALKLLLDEKYEVEAFYLKIWLEDEFQFLGDCPFDEDISYAKQVCDKYNVKLNIISMQKEYWDKVVSYTISEVKTGRTPNPDMMCNLQVKFGAFFEKMSEFGKFDLVASGHYATREKKDSHYYLKCAPDPIKDQAYFLARLSQSQLEKIIFPIGNLSKEEVRDIAKKEELANMERKDSQGICFLGKIKYKDFIKEHLGTFKGEIREAETDEILGEHDGYYYHTIGQRKGLKLSGGPWYVVKKDSIKNIVYVSRNYYEEDKNRKIIRCSNFNWIPEKISEGPYLVKLRHGEEFHQANLRYLSEEIAEISLKTDDQGIAAGQFIVFYQDGYCLASAVIN